MSLDQVKQFIDKNGIDFFLCSFVEMSGAPKAKLVPVTNLEEMAEDGAGFAGFAAGEMGQKPHDPDMANIPDFDSMMVVPWRDNMAWVAGNIHVQDEPWPYCPRTILQRQLARAKDLGYSFKVGVEPEFMLLTPDGNGGYEPWDELDTLGKPCYDLRALHRNLDLMTTLVKYCQGLGWNPYAVDHEDGTCQFELNWDFADALTTADRQTFYKWMVKTVAEEHGLVATFMPKPLSDKTGNGAHYHMSLWDAEGKTNLFLDKSDPNGQSELCYHFMGGVLNHAKGLAAVTNPIVNSYKRLAAGAPDSGATWAPVFITYGGSNRTQMVRIPGSGRIENRSVDGAANPYLSMAAMLAAGLDGIEQKSEPGELNLDNLYEATTEEAAARGIEQLPSTLAEAVECMAADDVVKEALGSGYAEYYIKVKREEWRQYHSAVGRWETDNYVGVY